MNLAADMGRHPGWAKPCLHDAPYRQIEEATGRRPTYLLPIAVQTNPATSADRLSYTAYTADGAKYDHVVIEKNGTTKRLITNDKTDPPARTFGNSMPYESPDF